MWLSSRLQGSTYHRTPPGYFGASQDLMLRLGSEATQRALREPHVRPMDFTGRPSGGMVYIGAAGVRDPSDLKRWIGAAAAFVATLPPRPSRVTGAPSPRDK